MVSKGSQRDVCQGSSCGPFLFRQYLRRNKISNLNMSKMIPWVRLRGEARRL